MANQVCDECGGDYRVCEHGRRAGAFDTTLGSFILARQKDALAAGQKTVEIGDLDGDLLGHFFNAGWSWGRTDKEAQE